MLYAIAMGQIKIARPKREICCAKRHQNSTCTAFTV